MKKIEDKLELRVDLSTPEGAKLADKFREKFGNDVKIYHANGESYDVPAAVSGLAIVHGYENVNRYFLGNK